MLADNDALDALVSEGLREGHLAINGQTADPSRPEEPVHEETRNLDDFLRAYGPMLGKQAERSLEPLHVPGRVPAPPTVDTRGRHRRCLPNALSGAGPGVVGSPAQHHRCRAGKVLPSWL